MRAERSLLVPVGGRELGHWRRRELRGMGDVGGGGVAAGGGGGGSGGSDGRDGSGGGGNGVGTHSCFPLAWRTHGGGSWRVQGRLPGAAAFPQFVQVRVVGSNRSLHVRSIPVTALRIWVDRRNACVSVSTKASKLPTSKLARARFRCEAATVAPGSPGWHPRPRFSLLRRVGRDAAARAKPAKSPPPGEQCSRPRRASICCGRAAQ